MRTMIKKVTSLLIAIAFLSGSAFSIPQAHASMIQTKDVIQQNQFEWDKEKLTNYLNQEEAQAVFLRLGVKQEDVQNRIDNMTPAELEQFNLQAETLPAGAGALGTLVSIVVLFAIIFIVTDLLGATDIYPFINSINK